MTDRSMKYTGIGKTLSLLPLVFLLAVSLFAIPVKSYGMDVGKLLFMSLIALAAITIHILSNMEKNWLRIDTVFLLSFFVVNFQWPLMYALTDLVPTRGYLAYSIEQFGTFASSLSAVAIICWIIGYAIWPKKTGSKRVDDTGSAGKISIAFFISIILFVYFAGEGFFSRSVYQSRNDDLTQVVTGIAAYLYPLVQIISVLSLSYIFYNRYILPSHIPEKRKPLGFNDVALIALVVLYCALFILAGDRGQVALVLLAAGLAFSSRVRAIRASEFFFLAAVGFLIFSVIAVWRTGNADSATPFIEDYGYLGISTNLAQSIVTLTQSIAIVDAQGFFWGQLWLSQILGVVPFAQSVVLSFTDLSLYEVSSSNYITLFTLGDNASSGLGTSFVADIYLNFGLPGVVIFSGIYGAICSVMAGWMRGDDGFYKYFVAITFGCLILYAPRSSILFSLRPMLWGIVLVFLLTKVRRLRHIP